MFASKERYKKEDYSAANHLIKAIFFVPTTIDRLTKDTKSTPFDISFSRIDVFDDSMVPDCTSRPRKWENLVEYFRPINVITRNNLFITMATFYGRFLYLGVDPYQKSPY